MVKPSELSFVFLGDSLPRYARSSLALAHRYSGLEVRLIGSRKIEKWVKTSPASFFPLEDFYNPDAFAEARESVSLSHRFRGGFWLKSLERFFVLDQFLDFTGGEEVFHAELDQLLFRCDKLVANIQSYGQRGLFFPFHGLQKCVASVFFCNNPDALKSLIKEAVSGGVFANEMELLFRWASNNVDLFVRLPTLADLAERLEESEATPPQGISPDSLSGVVDAAQLGQWVAGIDPRNVPIRNIPRTKFVDRSEPFLLTAEQLRELRFRLDTRSGFLSVSCDWARATRVYNLHLHSKIHAQLTVPSKLTKLISVSNADASVALPSTRVAQLAGFLSDQSQRLRSNPLGAWSRVRSLTLKVLRLSPSSYPLISNDTFRHYSSRRGARGPSFLSRNRKCSWKPIFREWEELTAGNSSPLQMSHPAVLLIGSTAELDSRQIRRDLGVGDDVQIFAQNLSSAENGVSFLPLGLENAALGKRGNPRHYLSSAKTETERLPRVLWNFSLDTSPEVRIPAANTLLKVQVADRRLPLNTRADLSELRKYCFVAAPPGAGADTHLLWEAMYSRTVPVVLRSPLTDFYASLGMPVFVLDNYAELKELTEVELKGFYESLATKFSSAVLRIDFWFNRIERSRDLVRLRSN